MYQFLGIYSKGKTWQVVYKRSKSTKNNIYTLPGRNLWIGLWHNFFLLLPCQQTEEGSAHWRNIWLRWCGAFLVFVEDNGNVITIHLFCIVSAKIESLLFTFQLFLEAIPDRLFASLEKNSRRLFPNKSTFFFVCNKRYIKVIYLSQSYEILNSFKQLF